MVNKHKPNFKIFLSALALAVLCLSVYEWYFRNIEHRPAGHDLESLDVWADQRSKVSSLDSNDVIILGSSRAHFDFNIHLWDSITGRRPIQLAYPGSSPYHPFKDIVENSEYNGLIVMGVAPGLFYTLEDSWAAGRGKKFVDHFHKRTYAQILNQRIYDFIDPHFNFLQEELTLSSLVDRIPLQNRDSVRDPEIWPPMVQMDKYRNIRMIPEMETDTVLQNRQKAIWFNPDPKNRYKDSVDVIFERYLYLVDEFKKRGGKIAFLRPPITGFYLETEPKLFPRNEYWDRLISESGCLGYHYADYPEMKKMNPPEWSHLNRKDSDTYTKMIVELLKRDKLL